MAVRTDGVQARGRGRGDVRRDVHPLPESQSGYHVARSLRRHHLDARQRGQVRRRRGASHLTRAQRGRAHMLHGVAAQVRRRPVHRVAPTINRQTTAKELRRFVRRVRYTAALRLRGQPRRGDGEHDGTVHGRRRTVRGMLTTPGFAIQRGRRRIQPGVSNFNKRRL